ncbi:hypothetical protein [uncultured Methylovirgula sp.]|uniref:hypothetical protein n=1 Tax=uncultured Methylovirgula sp. TaxID=1285960 RepID=UPI0026334B3C|nr:hypothetical protein [uncultured Methylovirgula sp.]
MRVGILLAGLAGFCLSVQAQAGSGFVAMPAPHGFVGARMAHAPRAPVFGRGRRHFLNGAVALDTLQTGAFQTGPDESDAPPLPPPYPPPGYFYPAYYAPPRRPCVRPLLIHVTAEKPAGRLPRVIYGTSPADCPE